MQMKTPNVVNTLLTLTLIRMFTSLLIIIVNKDVLHYYGCLYIGVLYKTLLVIALGILMQTSQYAMSSLDMAIPMSF